MEASLRHGIFQIKDQRIFRETVLEVFRHQAVSNPVYREYLGGLGVDPNSVKEPDQIPFLPVEFFRNHEVACSGRSPEVVFESSGTTGSPLSAPSRHYVSDATLYRESFTKGFSLFYGDPGKYCILALLPSYLERKGSSLVYMMDHLIRRSGHPDSGFYLDQLEELAGVLRRRNTDGYPTLLLGVSYALLDLAEKHPMRLGDQIIVMETGGMKGRRKELVRSELHGILTGVFGTGSIHSEYGMTELLSQAYSAGDGLFRCPPWMQVLIRDPNDPLAILDPDPSEPREDFSTGSRTAYVAGGLNIIDLANLYSCSFVATDDLGRLYPGGTFEVQGRFDHADVRGCNLLVI